MTKLSSGNQQVKKKKTHTGYERVNAMYIKMYLHEITNMVQLMIPIKNVKMKYQLKHQ